RQEREYDGAAAVGTPTHLPGELVADGVLLAAVGAGEGDHAGPRRCATTSAIVAEPARGRKRQFPPSGQRGQSSGPVGEAAGLAASRRGEAGSFAYGPGAPENGPHPWRPRRRFRFTPPGGRAKLPPE